MIIVRSLFLSGLILLLGGCFEHSPGTYQDLDSYIAEVKAKPTGSIKPLPEFRPYEAFTYSASGLRSPFEPPLKIALTNRQKNSNIRPDPDRTRQYLEQFEIDTFAMVGSISNDEGKWGLLRAEDGVHRVKVGDYLGRNHGRITFINDEEVQLMEIIPAGPSFWIERPRRLSIRQ